MTAIQTKLSTTPLVTQRSGAKLTFTYAAFSAVGNYPITTSVSSITVSGMSGGQQLPVKGITFGLPNAGTIIYASATVVGLAGNYAFTSSTPTALTFSSMTGGTESYINNSLHTIYSSTTYPMALPVLYTKTSGTSLVGLTSQTTYYVIPYSSTSFMLATTRANATTGNFVYVLGISTAGGGAYVVTPIAFSTATVIAGFQWQYGNDGINFINIPSISSVTVTASTTANSSVMWDFSKINFRYIKLNFIAPTWGAVKLLITGNGSKVAP